MQPAEVLALSDERDQWLRRLLRAERDAYRRGYDDGLRRGLDETWQWRQSLRCDLHPGAPTHAELELRRWGPGGREHFGDPRPGDYPGRAAEGRP